MNLVSFATLQTLHPAFCSSNFKRCRSRATAANATRRPRCSPVIATHRLVAKAGKRERREMKQYQVKHGDVTPITGRHFLFTTRGGGKALKKFCFEDRKGNTADAAGRFMRRNVPGADGSGRFGKLFTVTYRQEYCADRDTRY